MKIYLFGISAEPVDAFPRIFVGYGALKPMIHLFIAGLFLLTTITSNAQVLLNTSATTVFLFEEVGDRLPEMRVAGKARWQLVKAATEGGLSPLPVVYAELDVPGRFNARLKFQRSAHESWPATYALDLNFRRRASLFIHDVQGIELSSGMERRILKTTRRVHVKNNQHFIVDLLDKSEDGQRNVDIIRGAEWVELPIVYDNGMRAVLAISLGSLAKKSFDQAISAWSTRQGGAKEMSDAADVSGSELTLANEGQQN